MDGNGVRHDGFFADDLDEFFVGACAAEFLFDLGRKAKRNPALLDCIRKDLVLFLDDCLFGSQRDQNIGQT